MLDIDTPDDLAALLAGPIDGAPRTRTGALAARTPPADGRVSAQRRSPAYRRSRRATDLAALILAAGRRRATATSSSSRTRRCPKQRGGCARSTTIEPAPRAVELAGELGKDPRHVQAILDESAEVVRAERGVLIVRTHHGFVCANAGVDESNAPDDGTLVLLPLDPDGAGTRSSARACASAPATRRRC